MCIQGGKGSIGGSLWDRRVVNLMLVTQQISSIQANAIVQDTATPAPKTFLNTSTPNPSSSPPSQIPRPTCRQARRQIPSPSPPTTLLRPKVQHQLLPLQEETMIDPVLGVWLPVQGGVLDIDVLVSGIEVDVADRGCVARLPAFDAYAFEVGGDD